MKTSTQTIAGNAEAAFVQAAQQANRALIDGLAQGNAAQIAARYGTEAQAFVPHVGLLTGAEALLAAWQGGIDQGVRRVTVDAAELVQAGALGYECGVYTILDEQGAASEQGHYLIVWRQEGGQWQWHRHIWNYHFKVVD